MDHVCVKRSNQRTQTKVPRSQVFSTVPHVAWEVRVGHCGLQCATFRNNEEQALVVNTHVSGRKHLPEVHSWRLPSSLINHQQSWQKLKLEDLHHHHKHQFWERAHTLRPLSSQQVTSRCRVVISISTSPMSSKHTAWTVVFTADLHLWIHPEVLGLSCGWTLTELTSYRLHH